MNLILLPGNHPANNQWIFDLEAELKPYYNLVATQHYAHWDSDASMIDVDHELSVLVQTVSQWQEDYAIMAKSAGVLVTLKGIQQGLLRPKKCIFIGVPAAWAHDKGIEVGELLRHMDVPVLFIQKAQDPAGTFSHIQAMADQAGLKQVQFVELPGGDHHYEDTAQLKELILQFIQQPD